MNKYIIERRREERDEIIVLCKIPLNPPLEKGD